MNDLDTDWTVLELRNSLTRRPFEKRRIFDKRTNDVRKRQNYLDIRRRQFSSKSPEYASYIGVDMLHCV